MLLRVGLPCCSMGCVLLNVLTMDSVSALPCCSMDGWVVCVEHKDILLAAWDEDQEIQRQRDIEVHAASFETDKNYCYLCVTIISSQLSFPGKQKLH